MAAMGATLAASRRLKHRQLRADSGRSHDGDCTAQFDPKRPSSQSGSNRCICP